MLKNLRTWLLRLCLSVSNAPSPEDRYLAAATDLADLERRLIDLHASGTTFCGPTRRQFWF